VYQNWPGLWYGRGVEGVVRETDLAPDVPALARALRGSPGLAVLTSSACGALSPGDARFSFLACAPVEVSDAWVPPPGVPAPAWAGHASAPRWVGVIPYEATRDLERKAWTRFPDLRAAPALARPRWRRYDAVARADHVTGRVVVEADTEGAARALHRRLARTVDRIEGGLVLRDVPRATDAEHADRIREALRLIAQGDVYQVNLARRLGFDLRGDPLEVFFALARRAPSPYAFFADLGDAAVCATSPELALEVRGDLLRTAPIKGTRPRGADRESDARLAADLDADPKERAELTMAIDLHRNDLGRVAVPGSVRLVAEPHVVAGRTVWSRLAEIRARRAPGATLEHVVRAMIPCGSVTGAPKVRAMEVIAHLEPHRRGLYTGAFGYVGRDGGLLLAMAIRTLEVAGDTATYFAGGGIVADSDPAREVDETLWKAMQLLEIAAAPAVRRPATRRTVVPRGLV
jgi:anthranilate/para-aminobenzoate synthase component I